MASKTGADPTGQRANRRRTAQRLDKRLDRARKRIKRAFAKVPKTRRRKAEIRNDLQTIYDYGLTPQELADLQQEIRRAIDGELGTTPETLPQSWWFESEVELPYRQGTQEQLVEFNQMVAAAIAAGVLVRGLPPRPVDAERVVASLRYRNALADITITNYNNIKSLSSTVASQVIREINTGMKAGFKPTEIAERIDQRFEVGRSSAERIAQTEINAAYTNGKMDSLAIAEDQSGLRAGVIHISALTPTTRDSHAARHGNAYTVEQQREWWDQGANRINCKCDVKPVLLDASGNVVQAREQEEIREEGEAFFAR